MSRTLLGAVDSAVVKKKKKFPGAYFLVEISQGKERRQPLEMISKCGSRKNITLWEIKTSQ